MHSPSSYEPIDDAQALKVARHVTWVGFWINAFLGAAKIAAGILGRSSAMVADGVHSFSDFASDIVVIIFVGLSRRKANDNFQYGHGKYETLATLLLGVLLTVVAAGFLIEGAKAVWEALATDVEPPRPGWVALAMAVASIGSKEWLYHYTRRAGKRINSPVVIANAWHHRSDALSSLATLVGIAGAMFLGEQWRILDPIASMIVAGLILMVAFQVGHPALLELLEAALPREITDKMYAAIAATPGVEAFHRFASRRNGNTVMADFHIKVRPDITVEEAHHIATDVEHRLRQALGNDRLRVNIHVEPYHGQAVGPDKMCK